MKRYFVIVLVFLVLTGSAQFSKLLDFTGSSTGAMPYGSLVSDGNYLYGMTSRGGVNDSGTVFKIKMDGSGFTKLLDFTLQKGFYPIGNLIYDGTYLYGIAGNVIFKILTDGSNYTLLHKFGSILNDGAGQSTSLCYDGTFLYGTTFGGGTVTPTAGGTVFKLLPDGTGYTLLHSFNGNGTIPTGPAYPYSEVICDGTYLYGTVSQADQLNGQWATCYKISTNGSSFSTFACSTSSPDGEAARSGLVSDGTFLYGMLTAGGLGCSGGCGTIYKVKPDGTSLTKLFDFNGTTNGSPSSFNSKLLLNGNILYGMNSNNIFSLNVNGSGFVSLYNFSGSANGGSPYGSLINVGSSLYGMTNAGGSYFKGVIFKYDIGTIGFPELKTENEELRVYPNPASGLINVVLRSVGETPFKIELRDAIGRIVYSEIIVVSRKLEIPLTNLSSGLYLLSVTEGTKTIYQTKIACVK